MPCKTERWKGGTNCTPAVDNIMEVHQKLKIELSLDPAVPLLGIYLKYLKAGS